MAEALHHAHEMGVVHRDLKPANIMLDDATEPHIMDFGLARRDVADVTMTIEGQVLGTPTYMSPEQAKGDAHTADRRTDVYSLGVVLYELLTGAVPFRGNVRMIIHQVINDEAPSPRKLNNFIPRDLETICLKCLEKSPAKRYSTTQEVAAELGRFLNGEPVHARPLGRLARTWRWCRRYPVVASLTGLAALLLLGIAGISAAAYFQTRQSLGVAQTARNKAQEESARAQTALAAEEKQRRLTQTTLVDMHTSQGLSAAKHGEVQEALLWFATAVDAAKDDEERQTANRMRFRNWTRQLPIPVAATQVKEGSVRELVIHPSNKFVLLDTSAGPVIWNLPKQSLSSHPGCRAIWSRDGTLIAIGKPDGIVIINSFPNGNQIHRFERKEKNLPQLAFSHDGQHLAMGGLSLRVYSLDQKRFVSGESPHPSAISSVEFSNDDSCVVTSCADLQGRVFSFDPSGLDSSSRFSPVHHKPPGATGGVGMKFVKPMLTNDNQALFVEGNARLRLVDLSTGKLGTVCAASGSSILASAALSEDTRRLVISCEFGDICTFDVRTGPQLASIPKTERIPGVAIQPDSELVATIGHDSVLRCWNAATGKPATAPFQHQGRVEVVAFSPDGALCATAQPDQLVRVFRMPHSPQEADASIVLGTLQKTHEMSVDQTARWMATPGSQWGPGSTDLRVYDALTGHPSSPPLSLKAELIASAMSPDGQLVAALGAAPGSPAVDQNAGFNNYGFRAGQINVWNWRKPELDKLGVQTSALPRDAVFSPNGELLVVTCADGEVICVATRTSTVLWSRKHSGEPHWGYNLPKRMIRFSHRGDILMTLGFGTAARLWKTDGTSIAELPHSDIVFDADFSTDDSHVATASKNGEARVWDAKNGRAVSPPLKHPDWATSVSFAHDGRLLATGCVDHVARVWDWQAARLACPGLMHTDQVWSAKFSLDGKFLISSSFQYIGFWEIRRGQQMAPWRVACDAHGTLCLNDDATRVVLSGTPRPPQTKQLETFFLGELSTLDQLTPHGTALLDLAEIVSARRMDAGGPVFLTSQEWQVKWQAFHQNHPDLLKLEANVNDQLSWHRRGMDVADHQRNWAGMLMHTDHLIRLSPRDETALAKRARALAELGRIEESVKAIAVARQGIANLEPAEAYYPRSILDGLKWVEQFQATGSLRINCGGPEFVGADGSVWTADRCFENGTPYSKTTPDVAATEDDDLYRTGRFVDQASSPLRYRIPVPPGDYRVMLHFAETGWRTAGVRTYQISLEGERVVTGYDPSRVGLDRADIQTQFMTVDDGILDIELTSVKLDPMISAIEIHRDDGQRPAFTDWPGWPMDAPVPAIAPFSAVQAKKLQAKWAAFLQIPVEYENSLGMKFRLIPPGEFTMGAPDNADPTHHDDEKPAHRVRIKRPFYLGMHEVTVGQFRKFVDAVQFKTDCESSGKGGLGLDPQTSKFERKPEYTWHNPGFRQRDDHPVGNVSWNDAQAFCAWLAKAEQRKHSLPTDAQWEMACRAGTTGTFYFGDDRSKLALYENVADISFAKAPGAPRYSATWDDGHIFAAPVGSLKSNAYGLHDLLGNVTEWCSDRYEEGYYRRSPFDDPMGPADEKFGLRVVRGASWGVLEYPSHGRYRQVPSESVGPLGFRIAVEIDWPKTIESK